MVKATDFKFGGRISRDIPYIIPKQLWKMGVARVTYKKQKKITVHSHELLLVNNLFIIQMKLVYFKPITTYTNCMRLSRH